MGVEPKIGGKHPKMDGENNGSKPYFLMHDLGVPLFLETSISENMTLPFWRNPSSGSRLSGWAECGLYEICSNFLLNKQDELSFAIFLNILLHAVCFRLRVLFGKLT